MENERIVRVNLGIVAAVFIAAQVLGAKAAAGPATLEVLANPKDAPVSIVVYSDYACPYSSQFYFQLEALEKKYPNRLRVMMRQLPLSIHEQSPLAHEAALAAAAQGKLSEMSELLFANQSRLDRTSLISYAGQLHLDVAAFQRDLDTHAYQSIIDEDKLEADALGIHSTPTIFLNGRRLDGYQDLDVLDKGVAQVLANASAAQRAAVTDEGPVDAETFQKLTKSAAEMRGPANAPVTIVEFSDFQCPFCRQAVKPLEDLLEARPGQVRLIFRSYPLDFHQYSEQAHEAALAAGAQGKFWQMHDLIFSNQGQLERADLLRYAEQLHLDVPVFQQALDTHAYAGAIAADRALGTQLDVNGTPTMFVNGERITGAHSLVELEELVDRQASSVRAGTANQAGVVSTAPEQETHTLVGGETAAPVRVVWFSDVRSPLAKRSAELVRSVMEQFPDKVRVDFKTMELANHADAELASRALLAAAAQQKFWPMFDALAAKEGTLDVDAAVQLTVSLGLDGAQFKAALESAETTEAIERDQAEEVRRAITGSPAMFVEGQRIDGLQPERVYKAAIDAAIARSGKTQTASAGR